ncbi:MAG: hypothetical protein ACI86H_002179 [bacterium]|jgi:hypothetical protein
MSFHNTLHEFFPSAVPVDEFLKKVTQKLNTSGFEKDNSLACINVCRNDGTRSVTTKIEKQWGEAFNFSSLAGFIWIGKTGFLAAVAHAPTNTGRKKYVFFSMPHVAIGDLGEVGVCKRKDSNDRFIACASLVNFQKELQSGNLSLELDPQDLEQSLLKQKLFKKIYYGHVPGLITLTKLSYETILDDLESLIESTLNIEDCDYAVISGILIHGPDGEDYIWPGRTYELVFGNESDISIFSNQEDDLNDLEVTPFPSEELTSQKEPSVLDNIDDVDEFIEGLATAISITSEEKETEIFHSSISLENYQLHELSSYQTDDLSEETRSKIKMVILRSILEKDIPRFEKHTKKHSPDFFEKSEVDAVVYKYNIITAANIHNDQNQKVGGILSFLVFFAEPKEKERRDKTNIYFCVINTQEENNISIIEKIQSVTSKVTQIIKEKHTHPMITNTILSTRNLW